MKVTIICESGTKRYEKLEKRIWEKFPSIGGIESDNINTRQRKLVFTADGISPEELRSFFDAEHLSVQIDV